MITFILITLIVSDVMSKDLTNKTMDAYIVRGADAYIESYPHAVLVRFKLVRPSLCGASLIMAQVILTAGTCTDEFRYMGGETMAYLGHEIPKYATVVRKVVNYKLHPHFNERSLKNNLALMFLQKPVVFGLTVKKIMFVGPQGIEDKNGYGVGWGRQGRSISKVMSRKLKITKQRMLHVDDCMATTGLRLSGHRTMCGMPLFGQFYKDDAGSGVIFKGKDHIFLGAVLSHLVDIVAIHTFASADWIKKPAYEMYRESCGIKDHRRRTKRQAEKCADFNVTDL